MERKWIEEQHQSPKNTVGMLQREDEDDADALSLSELPLSHDLRPREKQETESNVNGMFTQGEFDFCPLPKETEMCAADEVFFQGQVLPLQRHWQRQAPSVSSFEYSSAGFSSSRSSSIGSHRSSSSGSSAAAVRPRGFHSLPSPSPGTPFRRITGSTSPRNIAKWDVLKLGLVTAPRENPFLDVIGEGRDNSDEKKKPRNAGLNGCRCSSAVAVDVVAVKRSRARREHFYADAGGPPTTKKQFSHRRTFEWLMQLSLEDPSIP